jgi:hypothetical protein
MLSFDSLEKSSPDWHRERSIQRIAVISITGNALNLDKFAEKLFIASNLIMNI